MTVDARDVADALAIAWDAFIGVAADDLGGWGRHCCRGRGPARAALTEDPDRTIRSGRTRVIQREQLTSFRNRATGWFAVADGALLLAAGETWQMVEHHRWPTWLFWLLIAVMLAAAVLNTAVRMISDEHARRSVGAEPARRSVGAEPARRSVGAEPAPAAEQR
jgi:hypothetical protein